jgi:hypothetical protein
MPGIAGVAAREKAGHIALLAGRRETAPREVIPCFN